MSRVSVPFPKIVICLELVYPPLPQIVHCKKSVLCYIIYSVNNFKRGVSEVSGVS